MTAEITIWKYYIYLSWVARLMSYDQFHIGDLKSCILSYYTNIFHRILFFQIFLYNFFCGMCPLICLSTSHSEFFSVLLYSRHSVFFTWCSVCSLYKYSLDQHNMVSISCSNFINTYNHYQKYFTSFQKFL